MRADHEDCCHREFPKADHACLPTTGPQESRSGFQTEEYCAEACGSEMCGLRMAIRLGGLGWSYLFEVGFELVVAREEVVGALG